MRRHSGQAHHSSSCVCQLYLKRTFAKPTDLPCQGLAMGVVLCCGLRSCHLGRHPGARIGLHCQSSPPAPFLPHEYDAIHHTDPRPSVSQLCDIMAIAKPATSFMDSLQWVDYTYAQKHKSDDPSRLRAMYHANLRLYATHGDTSPKRSPLEAASLFLFKFSRKAGISLVVYFLSFLPLIGRFVLPAASFYTFRKAVGTVPASIVFGVGVFLPRHYLVVFLQSYFSSRSMMRELVSRGPVCGEARG